MKKSEKIIEKIKKVLELSKNNPSEEEAKSAALKAQKLMAEYHISISEVEGIDNTEEITEKSVVMGKGNKWKYHLASIVAENFYCKCFFYGNFSVVFYGHEADAAVAAETFKFLFETGNKTASNYYNKLRTEARKAGRTFKGKGIKNCFLIGYMRGIKEELEKQCTALMIVVPEDVQESFAEKTKDYHTLKNKLNTVNYGNGQNAFNQGLTTGKEAINSRKLAML